MLFRSVKRAHLGHPCPFNRLYGIGVHSQPQMSHFTAILELFLSYVPSTVILEFCAFNLSMKSVVFISWQNEFNKKIVHFREFVYYFDHQAAKTKRWENLKMQTICRQNQTLKSANSLNGYLRFNNVVPPGIVIYFQIAEYHYFLKATQP